MRKMGIDYGEVRIGVAFSDLLGIIATGYETYVRKNIETDLQHFKDLVVSQQVDKIIMGLPLNMDGTEGERVEFTYSFCDELKKYTTLPIVYQDERLTTVSAEKLLISADVRREKRKKVIDEVAASIILQNYLDKKY